MAEPFLPSRHEELLLKAAFDTGSSALRAWQAWRPRPRSGGRLSSSDRLLPLVHRNLSLQGFTGGQGDRLFPARFEAGRQAVRRQAALARAMEVLRRRQLPSLVLKGAALAQLHYADWSLRPMTDVDLLVRPQDVPAALELLTDGGWRPLEAPPADCERDPRHAVVLAAPASRLDLHWRVLPECVRAGDDDAFWDGAVPCVIEGQAGLALQPADQLLHAISHGVRWSKPGRPGYWVADALTILRSSVCWERFGELALERDLAYVTGKSLLYLAREFAAPVPAKLLGRLGRARPAWLLRVGHTAEALAPSRRSPLHALGLHALNHRRLRRGGRVDRGWRGTLQALEIAWGTRGLQGTLLAAPVRVFRRCLGRLARRHRVA